MRAFWTHKHAEKSPIRSIGDFETCLLWLGVVGCQKQVIFDLIQLG